MDNPPLLYYRTQEQIEAYRRIPAIRKIRKMEMEMELMYYMRLTREKETDKSQFN
jgi:hypothetical protein